jgi:hypothetical protein
VQRILEFSLIRGYFKFPHFGKGKMTYKILGILKSLKYFIQTMEFGASHLNSLKKLLSLKKFPHPNTLLGNWDHLWCVRPTASLLWTHVR